MRYDRWLTVATYNIPNVSYQQIDIYSNRFQILEDFLLHNATWKGIVHNNVPRNHRTLWDCGFDSMNFTLNWKDNLTANFKANLTFKYQSLCIVFVGAVDTILPGMYRGFHFDFKKRCYGLWTYHLLFDTTFWKKREIASRRNIHTVASSRNRANNR